MRALTDPIKQSAWWQRVRANQQLKKCSAFLMAHSQINIAYSPSDTARALQHRRSSRVALPRDPRTTEVVAFGTRDWEQNGLWPSFERTFSFELFDYQRHRSSALRRNPTASDRNELARAFLSWLSSRPTRVPHAVFFYAAGSHISASLLSTLQERGIWTIVMSLDDKQQLTGVSGSAEDQLRVARQADLYWTVWRGGADLLRSRGGNPWYAPEGASPDHYYPVDVERDIDCLFIGKAYGVRRQLVNYLRARGVSVVTFGSGWQDGELSQNRVLEYYSRATVVLGVGGVAYMKEVQHLKGRDFEVPMSGALYLTSFNPELADHFRIGQEIVCYSSFFECWENIIWLKCHPFEACTIRHAGRQRCLKEHTWETRLETMYELLRGRAE